MRQDVNHRAEDEDAMRESKHSRNLKKRKSKHDNVNCRGRNRGHGQRKIDSSEDSKLAGAAEKSGFFESCVHRRQSGHQKKKCWRHEIQRLNENHSFEGEDVEWRLLEGD